MDFKDISIRLIRKVYRFITRKSFELPSCDYDRRSVNKLLFEVLNLDQPFMISRFGTTELITINNYLCIQKNRFALIGIWDFIIDNTHTPWWNKTQMNFLDVYSGVYPPTQETSIKFSERYLIDIPLIDVLGSFQYYEKFMPLNRDIKKVQLETLYPFFVENPWTKVLAGKKVLVVHPFEDTIKHQYRFRTHLFDNPDILPEFELITLKAVQSAAGIRPPFENWFLALSHMEEEISRIEFDICLIGCGAYGLPLAAHVKRIGKKAIHMGGGLQLLFGIKGKRWDNPDYGKNEYHQYPELMKIPYVSLYNEYWIRPLESDTPKSSKKLDGAIYW
jgi:hypothetical protein